MPDNSLTARLDAFYQGLAAYRLATDDRRPGDSHEAHFAREAGQHRENERLGNLRVFTPTSLVTEADFTPLLDCPRLEEAAIADLAGADSTVMLALEARGVRVT